jgi:hypothetical protein
MPKKRFSAEQIVTLLRQIEVSMAQVKPTPVACREDGSRDCLKILCARQIICASDC